MSFSEILFNNDVYLFLQASEIPAVARVRSLSVGNENKWKYAHHANNLLNEQQRQHNVALLKQQKQFLSAKEYHWNNTDLRKQELIEIIRDSMEKNRLCFQSNRYDLLLLYCLFKKFDKPLFSSTENPVIIHLTQVIRNQDNVPTQSAK